MRHLGITIILGTALATLGCAAGFVGTDDSPGEVRLLTNTLAPAPRVVLQAELAPEMADSPPAADDEVAVIQRSESSPSKGPTPAIQLTIDETQAFDTQPAVADPSAYGPEPAVDASLASDAATSVASTIPETAPVEREPEHIEAFASDALQGSLPEMPNPELPPVANEIGQTDFAQAQPTLPAQDSPFADDAEPIVTPGPIPRSPFRAGDDVGEQDRFTRQVIDVPVDIRPTEGAMPEDLAAAKFADEPTIDETFPSDVPPDVFCSHTPWTFCYRPLYFEDIKLERYGCNIGYAQTGLSGVRFFGSILALPYKMTVRPPRSCQCSNGFSRCGDCPLPGYGRREFRIDASLIEAAAVAGVVYILP